MITISLQVALQTDDGVLAPSDVQAYLHGHREQVRDVDAWRGAVRMGGDGLETVDDADYADPVIRLVGEWLRRVPWVIGGDTESLTLRNSEQCYVFAPRGDSLELSFYWGDPEHVDSYVVKPALVSLRDFVAASLQMGRDVVSLVAGVNEDALLEHEDCRDLKTSLSEAEQAWHDYELHHRR